MAIRFHLDEHVSPIVAEILRQRGIGVTRTAEVGLLGSEDEDQLRFAASQGHVLVTNDCDYVRMSREGFQHRGIVYYPNQLSSPRQIADALILIHAVMEPHELHNRVEYI